jgi:hypothetical protein
MQKQKSKKGYSCPGKMAPRMQVPLKIVGFINAPTLLHIQASDDRPCSQLYTLNEGKKRYAFNKWFPLLAHQ